MVAREWLEMREAGLLPVPCFHVLFSLPAQIADIVSQNEAVIGHFLMRVSADVMLTIATDPEHLSAKIAITFVLHMLRSALMHHPHVHTIVPGGGISPNGTWIRGRAKFLLPVRGLSALFRRCMLEALGAVHRAAKFQVYNEHAFLRDCEAFTDYLAPLKENTWHVYAKRPLRGPQAVLAYLARYTHRIAVSNRRLLQADAQAVSSSSRITCPMALVDTRR